MRYEIFFLEIGTDKNHVHFLVQSVPMYYPKKITNIVKSITAIEIFKLYLEVKTLLWEGKFWTSGYYVNTVGQYGNVEVIKRYVKNQGKVYNRLHQEEPKLF